MFILLCPLQKPCALWIRGALLPGKEKMISYQLQSKMHLMEMAIFPLWLKSNKKKKEKITKDLARIQADMILSEIEEQSKKQNYEKVEPKRN